MAIIGEVRGVPEPPEPSKGPGRRQRPPRAQAPEPWEPAARRLSWSRTVAREAVHRASVAEVLLTDVRALGGDRFVAAAQWPRSHPTFPHGPDGRHHPLMVAETLRQLGIYLPSRHFATPAGARFVIRDLFFALDPAAEPRAEHGATDVVCRAAVTDVRTTPCGRFVSGLRLDIRLLAGGTPFARAGGTARFLAPEAYRTARRAAPAAERPRAGVLARPAPRSVAVPAARDVLVVREAGIWRLDPADLRHPFFFDHWSDHVPGLVLLEAARQAAALATEGVHTRPVGCRFRALRFTEFAPPARVECVPHGRTCVFRLRQAGERTVVGVLQYP
ncbi:MULTISPECIES: ScbA/BarX family gamma-butyrolactone biosynthesis protein [unclassified Streptomyces]|uniref:ScbA/BarX family gamma-butyrolactone biosynthesis protein n=1 Tax=unclassified Streptomyces TaxID=2593676 RepID=UPI00336A8C3A